MEASTQRAPEGQTGTIILGYVTAVLIFPVGFIIGLTQINRSKHGWRIVALSLVVPLLVILVALLATHSGGSGGSGSA